MTRWSIFWILKVFKTVLHWLYQTNNPIKVTPRSDQSIPKAARKVTPMIDLSNSKQWYPTFSHEVIDTWNNLNGKTRLFAIKRVRYWKW